MFVVADFLGWGAGYSSSSGGGDGTGSGPIPLHILNQDAPGTDYTTPMAGWTDFSPFPPLSWSDFTDDIEDLVPYPIAKAVARQITPPGPAPAAWQAEFTYPRSRIAIRSVTSRNISPGNAIVTWDAGTDPGTVDCSTPDQTLVIQVVDPNKTTRSVNIGFEIENYESSCGARANHGDFQLVPGSFVGYDENGMDTSSVWDFAILTDSPAFR